MNMNNKWILLAALCLPLLFASCQSQSSKPLTGTVDEHDWVDLGLSVKWATCNVGAEKPEAAGDYYAWGVLDKGKKYDWDSYKWGTKDNLTKYNPNKYYGKTDTKTVLVNGDDAAYRKWGKSWRMATKDEWEELYEKCTWEWTGEGYRITGPSKQSIFLPAAGVRDEGSKATPGIGYYWTSALNTNHPTMAHIIKFNEKGCSMDSYIRCSGLLIRPVLVEEQ